MLVKIVNKKKPKRYKKITLMDSDVYNFIIIHVICPLVNIIVSSEYNITPHMAVRRLIAFFRW